MNAHTFSLTVEIDPDWITYLTVHPDIFSSSRAGYWLRGVENLPGLGWLCWEAATEDEECLHGREPNREAALKAWQAGEPLPEHWFRLTVVTALMAWEEGVKRWGVGWYEEVDATREDIVVQLALLREVRYA